MGGPHTKFRRHSKISRLPRKVVKEMNRLLLEGLYYDQIADWLQEQGYDISKSAVGRHGKRFFEAYQKIIQTEEQARAIKGEIGEALSMEEATAKLLTQKVMEALVSDPGDILEHHRIIQAFAALQNSSVRREKLKSDLEDDVKSAADEVAKMAKTNGLSDNTVDEIKKKILGITA